MTRLVGLGAVLALCAASPAGAQSLADLVKETSSADTSASVAAPGKVIAGEVLAGSLLAAAAGYGVGLIAEATFCDDCDAGEPGGDTAGLVFGVPAGAVVGVYLVGRLAPPSGRFMDTLLGAAVGTAVFAGYAELLDGKGDLVRWVGVLFPAGMATMGFNKSREAVLRAGPPTASRFTRPGMELTVLRVTFD